MRTSLVVGVIAGFLLVMACGPKRVPTAQAPAPPPPAPAPKQNLIVLLPEADGKVGRIVVSNKAGSQEVSQAYAAVRVERADIAPEPPVVLDRAQVDRLFGDTLKALPAAEVSFLLYFELATDEVTPESKKLFAEVLKAIRERNSTDVNVIGHTDTSGDSKSNYKLELQRAERVAATLRAMGVDPAIVTFDSHGEGDLLVKTPDGFAEPRNRRVEIVVR